MSEASTTFGIDLGTTYSCISYLKDGHPTVCLSLEGDHTTPSVVRMMLEDPEPVAGMTAKQTSILYPNDTIDFVKRKIGKVKEFEIGDPENRRTVTPEQVSAEILKKLAHDAEQDSGRPVKDVVITVPAYFGNNEKEATKEAGKLAGLNVVSLVEEPTAAAFYYLCEKEDSDATVCVFDLGGGTFDVTAIKKQGNEIRVITTDGNHELGGKDWDDVLMKHMEAKFREKTNIDPDEDLGSDFQQDLQLNCETAKKQLTQATQASIVLKTDNKHMANLTITRDEFDALTSSLLQTAIDLTRNVFDKVAEYGEKIDKLLMVGGSSKMPQVRAALTENFGSEVDEILLNDPDMSVSKGACIYCAWRMAQAGNAVATEGSQQVGESEITGTEVNEETGTVIYTLKGQDGETYKSEVSLLPGSVQNLVIKTVATKSFGIMTLKRDTNEEQITNLIIKDTVLPFETSQAFGTHTDNMTDISIELYQSEVDQKYYDPEFGSVIGKSVLTGLPAGLPADTPVTIHFKLNEEGIIEITGSYNGSPLNGRLDTSFAEGVGRSQ